MPNSADQHQQQPTFVDRRRPSGFVMLQRFILRAAGLTHTAKLLYFLLIDYAGQGETCFPKQETLARDLADPKKPAYSLDKVQDCLNELRAVKLLDWSRPNRNLNNVYSLLPVEESTVYRAPAPSLRTTATRSDTASQRSPDTASQRSPIYEQDSWNQTHKQQHTTDYRPSKADAGSARSDVVVSRLIEQERSSERSVPTQAADALVEALTNRGVSGTAARKLIREHPANLIGSKIALFDWAQEHQPNLIGRSSGGWLRSAIAEDYQPPKGYVPPDELQRRRQDDQAKREAADQEALEDDLRRMSVPPDERVAGYLAAKDRVAASLGRPLPQGDARAAETRQMLEKYETEQRAWFAEHPELADRQPDWLKANGTVAGGVPSHTKRPGRPSKVAARSVDGRSHRARPQRLSTDSP